MIVKNEIRNAVEKLSSDVLDGIVNPLEAFITLKKIEEVTKQVKSKIEDLAIEEASKHEKTFQFIDAEITLKSSAGRWDFKHISEIQRLEAELKEAKEQHKLAYKSKSIMVDADGVVVDPAIYKGGREILSIKLIK